MKIVVENLSKKYDKHLLFEKLNFECSASEKLAILGTNGSGKSSLMKILCGYSTPTTGYVKYETFKGNVIPRSEIYKHFSIVAPSVDLIESLSPIEFFNFYFQFKPLWDNITINDFFDICDLSAHKQKHISDFSSGMKQRLKLAFAILTNTSVLFLDEPCMNLDNEGVIFYKNIIQKFAGQRNIIVCSNNNEDEYFFCKNTIVL